MVSTATVDITLPRLAIKRAGEPLEVAKLVCFLLGDESTYTTGSVYSIDGGLAA